MLAVGSTPRTLRSLDPADGIRGGSVSAQWFGPGPLPAQPRIGRPSLPESAVTLARGGWEFLQRVQHESGFSFEKTRKGGLLVSSEDRIIRTWSHRAQKLRAAGLDIHVVDPFSARDLEPSSVTIWQVLSTPRRPSPTVREFDECTGSLVGPGGRVTVERGRTVLGIESRGGTVTGIRTRKGRFGEQCFSPGHRRSRIPADCDASTLSASA